MKIAGISSKKLPDAAEGHIKNDNLYNDKELDEEGDLNWYDYGARNYDPEIGRFVQIDPLSDEYQDLNPYEYADLDPISNVDIDGLGIGEVITLADVAISCGGKAASQVAGSLTSTILRLSGSVTISITNAVIQTIVETNTSQVGSTGSSVDPSRLAAIKLQGTSDAMSYAFSWGLSELGNSADKKLERYNDDYEKEAYLEGRKIGAGIALGMSAEEIEGGAGTAGAGLSTGPGAVVITTGGIIVALHGSGVAWYASKDIAWVMHKAYKLNITSNKSSSGNTNNSSSGTLSKPLSIGIYKYLRKSTKGLRDVEVHHLIEKRFKDIFGENARDMISKILKIKNHRKFTKAWRAKIPYGVDDATKEQVIQAAREIYKNHKDILKALEPYFK